MADAQDTGAEAPVAPLHVPPDWVEAAERIRRERPRTVVVIGAVDAGKSTLCRFLMDQAAQSGRSAALLDTDLGQKAVGPPACVTLAGPHGERIAFVGTTDPVLGWRRLIDGTLHLAGQADADILVVNTSGLLAGPGRRLKANKIKALRPDLLITIGKEPALETILRDHSQWPVLRLAPSPEARRKTGGERRRARRESFRRYFAQAPVLTVERGMLQGAGSDEVLPTGLLLGLSDGHGRDVGLGLLAGQSNGVTMEIQTPVAADRIGRITPGSLCLGENFSETRVQLAR